MPSSGGYCTMPVAWRGSIESLCKWVKVHFFKRRRLVCGSVTRQATVGVVPVWACSQCTDCLPSHLCNCSNAFTAVAISPVCWANTIHMCWLSQFVADSANQQQLWHICPIAGFANQQQLWLVCLVANSANQQQLWLVCTIADSANQQQFWLVCSAADSGNQQRCWGYCHRKTGGVIEPSTHYWPQLVVRMAANALLTTIGGANGHQCAVDTNQWYKLLLWYYWLIHVGPLLGKTTPHYQPMLHAFVWQTWLGDPATDDKNAEGLHLWGLCGSDIPNDNFDCSLNGELTLERAVYPLKDNTLIAD